MQRTKLKEIKSEVFSSMNVMQHASCECVVGYGWYTGTGYIIRQDLHFICLTIFVNLHGGHDNIFRKILIAF